MGFFQGDDGRVFRAYAPSHTIAHHGCMGTAGFDPAYVADGSFSTKLGCPRHVRFTPDSDRTADIAGGPFRANFGSDRTHSITASARERRVGGIVKPSALAVLMLMTSSKLVGCSTGMSAGFVPRRILSTSPAARRNKSGMFGP